jgi:hypothetical protein
MMKYTLLTTNGSVRQFYVLALAETYQSIYGGVIITDVVVKQQVLETT